ncbi:MAG: exopolysaccharide biosynthesis polyprenyl glycosylphosphotransferase, partial [Mycobacterium sp.]|nr:exopolysaccharide biosynthesis polyprenyl glycosylphosphotransferase [Mycobacterium sp.]
MQNIDIQSRPIEVSFRDGEKRQLSSTAVAAAHTLVPSEVFERTTWQRRYATELRLTDTIVVCSAVGLAQYLRFGTAHTTAGTFEYFVPVFSSVFIVVWLVALAGFHTRSTRIVGSGIEEYRRVIGASFWTFGAIAIVTLLLKIDVVRGYLAVALPVGILGLVLGRLFWRGRLARRRTAGGCQTAVLAIGELDAVQSLAAELTRNPVDGYRVVGIGVPGYGPSRAEQVAVNGRDIPIVGGESQVLEAIRTCGADTVAIAGTEHFGVRGIRKLIWDL